MHMLIHTQQLRVKQQKILTAYQISKTNWGKGKCTDKGGHKAYYWKEKRDGKGKREKESQQRENLSRNKKKQPT